MIEMYSRKKNLQAHNYPGFGSASRLPFSNEKRQQSGWTIAKSGKSFKWTSSEGQVSYSSKAVQKFLQSQSNEHETSKSEYEPEASASDDCFNSPEK